jgi:hypothetical protein
MALFCLHTYGGDHRLDSAFYSEAVGERRTKITVRLHDSAANSAGEDMANSAADPMANIERITTLADHSSSLTNVHTNTADKYCRNHGIGSNKKVEDMMCCPRRPSQHVCA